jgi:hypothetical protein
MISARHKTLLSVYLFRNSRLGASARARACKGERGSCAAAVQPRARKGERRKLARLSTSARERAQGRAASGDERARPRSSPGLRVVTRGASPRTHRGCAGTGPGPCRRSPAETPPGGPRIGPYVGLRVGARARARREVLVPAAAAHGSGNFWLQLSPSRPPLPRPPRASSSSGRS